MPSARELALILKLRDEASRQINRFATRAAEGINKFAAKADRSFRKAATGARKLINNMGALRNILVAGIGGVVARQVVRTFADFEKSMNRVAALTGEVVGPQFEMLNDLAKELGETTKFSARESAEAMSFLAMAGFETNEIMEALPRTLELAAAANLDLASSADIVTNILTGLRLPITELDRANDVLVATLSATNTDLLQLGQAFKFVGPVATAAGADFAELSAALGLLGNAGIQATMAGTSLRGAIAKLLNPTREGLEIMHRLGITVRDTEGEFVGFAEIVDKLSKSSDVANDALKLFGLRAGPGMAALVGQGADALRELTDELNKSGGIAKRVADIQLRGLDGALTLMKSTLEGIAITLGEALSESLIESTQLVRDATKEFKLLIDAWDETASKSEDAIGGINGFRESLTQIVQAIGFVVSAFRIAWTVISAVFRVGTLAITQRVTQIWSVFEWLIANLKQLPKVWAIVQNRWAQHLAVLEQVTMQVFQAIINAVLGAFETLFRKLGSIIGKVRSAAEKLGFDDIAASLTGAEEAMESLGDTVAKEMNRGASAIADVGREISELGRTGAELERALDFQPTFDPGQITADMWSVINETEDDLIAIGLFQGRLMALGQAQAAREAAAAAAAAGPDPRQPGGAGDFPQQFEDPEITARLAVIDELREMNANWAAENQRAVEQALTLEGNARRQFGQQMVAYERATTQRRLNIASTFLQAGLQLAQAGGERNAELARKLALAQAIVDGAAAINAALRNPPGWPYNAGMVAAVSALQAANVAVIAQSTFGSQPSTGSISIGGGGGAAAPAPFTASPGLPDEGLGTAPTLPVPAAVPQVSITVDGVVGNEEEVARRIAELVNQAIGQGAEVTAV